jgi:hypothetical protein
MSSSKPMCSTGLGERRCPDPRLPGNPSAWVRTRLGANSVGRAALLVRVATYGLVDVFE